MQMLISNDIYKFNLLSSSWNDSVVIYISNDHFGNSGEKIMGRVNEYLGDISFTLCELVVSDWDKYLTPWEAESNMKGRSFGGQADVLLSSIEKSVLPVIHEHVKEPKIYIAGYSFAGLFALWCLYESTSFDGAACCSGSLWYPDWIDYVDGHQLSRSKSRVYLSLGLKEKNTKHPLMKHVEDNMKHQYEILKSSGLTEDLHIDWHEGGHFSNTEERMAMGIIWLIEDKSESH